VAGGHVVRIQLLAVRPELAKLQPVVTDDARIGRAAGQVFVGEVVDDTIEVALEVEGVERDVEPVGHAAGVAGIDGATAALLARWGVVFGSVDAGAHKKADDFVPLVLQQVGGDGTIHAAAHGQNDASRHRESSMKSTSASLLQPARAGQGEPTASP
jgi:hypothetical protein